MMATTDRPARGTRFLDEDGRHCWVVTSVRKCWGEVTVFATIAEAYDLGATRAISSWQLTAWARLKRPSI